MKKIKAKYGICYFDGHLVKYDTDTRLIDTTVPYIAQIFYNPNDGLYTLCIASPTNKIRSGNDFFSTYQTDTYDIKQLKQSLFRNNVVVTDFRDNLASFKKEINAAYNFSGAPGF